MSHDVRLIDANALLDAMPKNDELLSLDVRRVICDAPAIDAVPVVRCGKCKLRHSSEFCECRPEDGFCSDGEPMEVDCEIEVRPIDANRLLEAIYEKFIETDPTGDEQLGYLACRTIVREMPTIDSVPVVRCPECRRRGKVGECPLFMLVKNPDGTYERIDYSEDNGFCHYGDPKDGGASDG